MKRSISFVVPAMTIVLTACAPPAAPVAPRAEAPDVPAVVAPSAAAVDQPAQSPARHSIATPERPDPLPSQLPPPTRDFLILQLIRASAPALVPAELKNVDRLAMDVISVHGTSDEDVWLLAVDKAGSSTLVKYDGKRVVERYTRPCGWVGSAGSLGIRFSMVRVDAHAVHVLASYREPDWRVGGDFTASLDRRTKKWSCTTNGVAPILVAAQRDFTWKLEDPAMGNGVCRLHAVGGPCLPTPWWSPSYNEPSQDSTSYGVWSSALWMRGLDDGWIANGDEHGRSWLFRFNGVAWSPIAMFERQHRIADVWADDAGIAWAVVSGKDGGWILRVEGHEVRSIPTPTGFDATRIRGSGPRDIWFVGAKHLYQWDGQRLHEMEALTAETEDVWASPGGDLWIVGGGLVSHTEARR